MLENVVNEVLPHAGVFAAGIGLGCLGYRHRGTHYKRNGVHVARGDGLSAKIIKRFPGYRTWSPVVDHAIAGLGMPAIFAGGVSIINAIVGSEPDTSSRIIHVLTEPYTAGAVYSYGTALVWDVLSRVSRYSSGKSLFDLGDAGQLAADVTAPLTFLYLASAAGLY